MDFNGAEWRALSEALQCAAVDDTTAGKVDDDINVRVLGNRVLHTGVDGKKCLLGAPVELLNVMATERMDHGGNGGS